MSQLSLEELYVSYYGRAADPAGLNYWESQEAAGQSDAVIATNFAPQLETLGLYPGLNTPTLLGSTPSLQVTFITAVYQNLFGHAPDTAGQSYWQGQLTAGANPGFMVNQIILGALGTDATSIANRATVAGLYTTAVASAVPAVTWNPNLDTPQSRTIINTITSSSTSVTAATSLIAAAIVKDQSGNTGVAGNTLILTGGPDSFALTATGSSQTTNNNDTILGRKGASTPGTAGASELTSSDNIQDGSGANVMNAELDNEGTVTPFVQHVQTLNLAPGTGTQTYNAASTSGETLINLAGGQFGATGGDTASWQLTVSGISTAVALGMSNAATFGEKLIGTFTGLSALGGNSATLVLNGNTAGTFDTNLDGSGNGVNTYNIQTTGPANTVTIGGIGTDTQLATINISGSSALTLNTAVATVTSINGASATGALTITDTAATKMTIAGGSGANMITATSAAKGSTLVGGSAGNDTLVFNGAVAANTLTGGGAGVGDTIQTLTGGMTFITAADVATPATLLSDLDVVTDYSAGHTTIDIKGGGNITTLSGNNTTLINTAGTTGGLLAAAQLAAADTGVKGLVAFFVGPDEYILQTNNTAGSFLSGDGLIKLTGAATPTFTGLVNT
jgi:hypothetical protein